MGGPRSDLNVLAEARQSYEALVPFKEGDHMISACNPRLVLKAQEVWLDSRWLTRHGKNGADDALVEDSDPEDIARRYHRVVIASGDQAFEPLAKSLRQLGVEVWVIARPGSLARALGRAAKVVGFLPPLESAQSNHMESPGTEPDAA